MRGNKAVHVLRAFTSCARAAVAVLTLAWTGGLVSGCLPALQRPDPDEPLAAIAAQNSAQAARADAAAPGSSVKAAPPTETAVRPAEIKTAGADGGRVTLGDGDFIRQPQASRGVEVTPEGEVELNFSEANVREVAQAVLGDILSLNVVVDSAIDQRITLRTNRPLKKASLMSTLETTLSAAGLSLIKEGDLYRIRPSGKARAGGSVTVAGKGQNPSGYGVTVVRLEHIAPSQMAKIIEPLSSERSILRVDDPRNILILAASGPETKSLLEAIETFDVSPLKGMSFGYFKLRNARSPQVMAELKELLRAYEKQTGAAVPQIVPIDRLNAFLVFASRADGVKLAQKWINQLDNEKNENEPTLHVYRMKNRKAKEMAALLSDLYQTGGSYSPNSQTTETAPGTRTMDMVSSNPAGSFGVGAGADMMRGGGQSQPQAPVQPDISRGGDSFQRNGLRIVADVENNSLLIRATQAEYQTIVGALARLDTMPPLVMVEVTIAEVTLNDNLKFGVEWFFKKGGSKYTFSGIDTGKILSQFPGFSYFFNALDVQVVLNAVAGVTNVKVLSSPKVMVMDNKSATLQIGDQVPITTGTSQSTLTPDAPIVQTVRYYDTGVILKVTPQVNSGGLVTMDINQEVSNVAASTNQNAQTSVSPTIQQRKINSSIAIQSGQAVVLGGLIRESKSVVNDGIPLLSEIPALGEAFKTHDRGNERTELIIIISPKVVWDRSEAHEVSEELKSKMGEIFGRR